MTLEDFMLEQQRRFLCQAPLLIQKLHSTICATMLIVQVLAISKNVSSLCCFSPSVWKVVSFSRHSFSYEDFGAQVNTKVPSQKENPLISQDSNNCKVNIAT